VTDVTSATGTSLAWTEYSPFGTIRASGATSQAPTNPFGFSGEYRDAVTGLYHLRARQYDPTIGRFLSTDPVGPAIGQPYVGAYVYVRNNPLRWVDPSGRETQPAGARDPGGCLVGLAGGLLLMETSTLVAVAGLGLQGISIAAFGFSLGVAAPVTAAGVVGGAMLEGIGLAGDLTGAYLINQSCLAGQ